jgi:hypothetical protein
MGRGRKPKHRSGKRLVNLHSLLGRHTANLKISRWNNGQFVSECLSCGANMVKPPGLQWQLNKSAN